MRQVASFAPVHVRHARRRTRLVVADESVLHAIVRVARGEHRIGGQRKVLVRERLSDDRHARRVDEPHLLREVGEGARVPRLGDCGLGQGEAGRGGDDAIEQLREALREHHPLASPLRAPEEVGTLGLSPIEGPHEGLPGARRHIERRVCVVAPRLRIVTERERSLTVDTDAVTEMPRHLTVGRRGRPVRTCG